MYFHWGEPGRPGAEHTVNHQQFPAEIQIYGFNTQLYSNLTVARSDMFPGEGGGGQILKYSTFYFNDIPISWFFWDNYKQVLILKCDT